MNLSPPNRERQEGASGGKDTNPDIAHGNGHSNGNGHGSGAPARAKPGSVVREGKTDEQLLEAYRFGDKTGFSQLVERYQRELFHFLVRFLGDRAAAED